MDYKDFIRLSMEPMLPPYLKEALLGIWDKIYFLSASSEEEIITCIHSELERNPHFNSILELICKVLYKENSYMQITQCLSDFLKSDENIINLRIEHPVFEDYTEGVAGPGDILFSFLKEKREKKEILDKKKKSKEKKVFSSSDIESMFNQFWSFYPRKKGRGMAEKAFLKIFNSSTIEPYLFTSMMNAIALQISERQLAEAWDCFTPEWPHAATWLRNKRWLDETQTHMEYWDNECRRTHKPNEYLRIRDRNIKVVGGNVIENGEYLF